MAVTKNNLPLREYGVAHTLETIHARCVEVGDCWEWLGAMSHGRPTIRSEGRKVVSLRAYIAHDIQGIAPEAGKYVTFNCGNPACVNPEHLSSVNRSALMKMTAKRTGYGMRPERRAKLSKKATERYGKLTPEQVNAIRLMDGTIRGIARETGITFDVVRKIRNGTTYRTQGNPWAGLMGATR